MIKKELQKYFIKLLLPAIILIVVVELTKEQFGPTDFSLDAQRLLNSAVMVLAAFTSLALPLLYRLFYIKKNKDVKQISKAEYTRFQKYTLLIVLSSWYIFVIASFLMVSEIAYYACFILALYGSYYYYPSERKVRFELRLFRVKEDD